MPTNVVVPSLGESVTEAVLLRWIKPDGDAVAKDEPLAELETDKANVDLPSPAAGVLRHGKKPNDSVKVGEVIGSGGEGNGSPAKGAAPVPTAPKAAEVKPAETKSVASGVKPE